eukprot:6199263-Pleurochrysis_carterae.AAC.3
MRVIKRLLLSDASPRTLKSSSWRARAVLAAPGLAARSRCPVGRSACTAARGRTAPWPCGRLRKHRPKMRQGRAGRLARGRES